MLLNTHFHSNDSDTSGFVWEQFDFEQCDSFQAGRYIWTVWSLVCFALGFPTSIPILWELFKTYRGGTPFSPNDFFILNVSVMDVVFLTFIPPGFLNHYIWKNWPFEACWNFVYALNTCGRPLLMACMCLDCYLAVVHPITYHRRKSLTPRVVITAIVWTLTIACGITYFLFYKLYITMFSTVPFFIAIIIIGVCDSFILYTLMKADPGRRSIHPQKQRAVQTLVNSLVMTVLFYLPPVLMTLIGNLITSKTDILMCTFGIPMTITSTSGSAVMPILHLRNRGKLNCFRIWCRKSEHTSASPSDKTSCC